MRASLAISATEWAAAIPTSSNLVLFGLASLAACFASNITVLILRRFTIGIGMGAELVVAAVTLCEFIPPAYRDRWISMLGIVTNAGLLLASSIGHMVIPNLGWRYMFGVAGVGALIVWIMRYVPELFPTEYRLCGTGVASVYDRAASITTPYLANYLFDSGVLWRVIVMLAALCMAILILRVETAKISLDDNSALASDAWLWRAVAHD